MSVYECPHCHKKTFNPITKAFAGQINSKGRVCKSCGRRCSNGMGSTIFNTIVDLAALIISIVCYLMDYGITIDLGFAKFQGSYVVIVICIVSAFVITRIFDAFFLPLTKPARTDAY
jgi:hypothetical protein